MYEYDDDDRVRGRREKGKKKLVACKINGSSRIDIGEYLCAISSKEHREIPIVEQIMEIDHRFRFLQRSLHLLQLLLLLRLLVDHPNQATQTIAGNRRPPWMLQMGTRSLSSFLDEFLRRDRNQKATRLIMHRRIGINFRGERRRISVVLHRKPVIAGMV